MQSPERSTDLSGDFLYNKKRHCRSNAVIGCGVSDSALNLVRTEASGTSVHMARSTVHNGLNTLYIGLPGSVGTSVGVGNLDTEGNTLTTIITLRHSLHLLSEMLHQNHALNRRLDMIAEFYQKSKCFFGNFFVF